MNVTPQYAKPKISGYTVELASNEMYTLIKFFGQLSRNDLRRAGVNDDDVESTYRLTSELYSKVVNDLGYPLPPA